jgi:hypothetical protein
MDSVKKPIDYTDKFLVIEAMCAPGKGKTYRIFYHSKGNLCTALVAGNGAEKKPGDKVFFRDIVTNGLASVSQQRRFDRLMKPPKDSTGSIDIALL